MLRFPSRLRVLDFRHDSVLGSGPSFAERRERKRTALVKRCLRMRRRDCLSILNYLTFPALPRKERKIYIQRSSFSTTVRSQTNVTHVVSVSKVSSKIQSSSKLISATSTPFSQQQRTSATFPQRRTNQQAQNCQISAPSAASLHNWQLPFHLFQLSQAQRQPQQILTVPSFINTQSNTANNPAGSL